MQNTCSNKGKSMFSLFKYPFLDNDKKVGDIRLIYQHALFIIRVYEAIVVV